MENVNKDLLDMLSMLNRKDRINEGRRITTKYLTENVNPAKLHELVSQYEMGEISYEELKAQMAQEECALDNPMGDHELFKSNDDEQNLFREEDSIPDQEVMEWVNRLSKTRF